MIAEILDGYAVDAFFFNWFGMSTRDYGGTYHGICQCQNCKRRFAAFSGGMALPQEESYADPGYPMWRRYTEEMLEEIAGRVRALIKSRRPDVALLLRYNPDITFHEINNAVERPLPLWRYHTGEAAKTSASAHPERPVAINAVMFWDLPYRFNAEQPGLTELVLAQVIANGANPYAYVLGHTRNQPDRKNYPAVRRMMQFHKANERHYEGIRSAAEVLLVSPTQAQAAYGDEAGAKAQAAFRGAYRALVENHLPFDVLPDPKLAPAEAGGASRATGRSSCPTPRRSRTRRRRCSTATWSTAGDWWRPSRPAPTTSRAWRARKGALALRSLGAARILARRDGFRELRGAYLRVTRREDLPDLPDTDFVAVDRAFLYVEAREGAEPSFAFLGPTPYGPPEKCWWEPSLETEHPGLLWHTHGEGRSAYFPWPVDALFYGHSLEESRALLGHAVRTVLGGPGAGAGADRPPAPGGGDGARPALERGDAGAPGEQLRAPGPLVPPGAALLRPHALRQGGRGGVGGAIGGARPRAAVRAPGRPGGGPAAAPGPAGPAATAVTFGRAYNTDCGGHGGRRSSMQGRGTGDDAELARPPGRPAGWPAAWFDGRPGCGGAGSCCGPHPLLGGRSPRSRRAGSRAGAWLSRRRTRRWRSSSGTTRRSRRARTSPPSSPRTTPRLPRPKWPRSSRAMGPRC